MFNRYKKLWVGLLVLIILSPLGLIATGTAFGEWGLDELKDEVGFIPAGLAHWANTWTHAIFPDYSVPGLNANFFQSAVGYIISAVVGVVLVAGITMLLSRIIRED